MGSTRKPLDRILSVEQAELVVQIRAMRLQRRRCIEEDLRGHGEELRHVRDPVGTNDITPTTLVRCSGSR